MDNAELIADYHDPARYNSLEPTSGVPLRWHERLEVMYQGTRWHRAGLATTPEQHAAIATAERAVYPSGMRMTETRTFGTEDPNTVVLHWAAEGDTWEGRPCHNGGLSIFEFEDGAVRRARHYTNTAYLEAIEEGWEALLPVEALLDVPAYHTIGMPSEAWRPFPIAPTAKTGATPAPEFDPPFTSGQRLALMFDPARPLAEVPSKYHYGTEPGAWMEFQGTRSPIAGRNIEPARDSGNSAHGSTTDEFSLPHLAQQGKMDPLSAAIVGTWDAMKFRLSHTKTWQSHLPDWGVMEWISDANLWDGRQFRNSGLTVVQFNDQGERRIYREFMNVAYIEAATAGWRERVPREAFAQLGCAETYDLPSDTWSPLPVHADPSSADVRAGL